MNTNTTNTNSIKTSCTKFYYHIKISSLQYLKHIKAYVLTYHLKNTRLSTNVLKFRVNKTLENTSIIWELRRKSISEFNTSANKISTASINLGYTITKAIRINLHAFLCDGFKNIILFNLMDYLF